MSTRGKVYRRTQGSKCPSPWAYVVARDGYWLVWLVQGQAATWRRAFDRVLQLIRAEGEA